MSSYYDDDEDIDIHVRHRGHSPRPVRYVQSPPRPRYYQPADPGPSWLAPVDHNRTTVIARSRSRSRDRRLASPPQAPAQPQPQPVIINNQFYNEYSSDDSEYDKRNRRRQVTRGARSPSSSESRSRSRSRERYRREAREQFEAESARKELEALRLSQSREKAEKSLADKYRDDAELQRAKRELEEIKRKEAQLAEQKRIEEELEHRRLKEERDAAEERKRLKKEAEAAIERYKQEERERREREQAEKEAAEKEYQRRLQEDLIKSGVDEKAIAAIMKKEKVPETEAEAPPQQPGGRATYTRMLRKHLSIETLRTYHVEWEYDDNPDSILIKRWVPEWEQDQLWKHTRDLRKTRGKALLIEEKRHQEEDPRFEWLVRVRPRVRWVAIMEFNKQWMTSP
ncbi:Reticulocyte-binding protein 2 a-like protein [Emericellopsis cladophorae]|uniref:Reticulocyte-binding protein 2 a-like protein n=1 Tax=Emericellopsis cladophorae TaxID=2686198 RepID=A0A9P9XWY9_9HYPO|nr:Reticulocyte-binding protein 2 a-like protein [Emericellopsis cladophorae]KAI6779088.1 Reticulocyte-binding protein 2 a-like protein [Emericellopsis cladophorae]